MNDSMIDKARDLGTQLVNWRREFHINPELGFQETYTASRVAEVMESLGYRVRSNVGRTGVVAERGEGGPTIAIRADMDALPIQEENLVPYISQVPNVMHACGHDAHTAMALGAATLLSREAFQGTVRFLFQPAEEVADVEGVSGAPRMIQDGAMEGVEASLALHVDASLAVGDISIDAGPSSAGVDTLYATILGQGGHGATPHKAVDPIYLAAHVILALNGIISRRLYPFEPAVISLGSIQGGEANNVIPERVELSGTIRYMAPEVQKQIHTEIERALQVARALGGDYQLKIEIGYPPMYNDPWTADLVRKVITDLLGGEHIKPTIPQMGAEDFGFFSDLAPGVMFYLGGRIEGDERKHHHPRFDLDERCLPIGSAVLAESALRLLKTKAPAA